MAVIAVATKGIFVDSDSSSFDSSSLSDSLNIPFTPTTNSAGNSEYQDVLAGAKFLQENSSVDAKRIGVVGHSYGGNALDGGGDDLHVHVAAWIHLDKGCFLTL